MISFQFHNRPMRWMGYVSSGGISAQVVIALPREAVHSVVTWTHIYKFTKLKQRKGTICMVWRRTMEVDWKPKDFIFLSTLRIHTDWETRLRKSRKSWFCISALFICHLGEAISPNFSFFTYKMGTYFPQSCYRRIKRDNAFKAVITMPGTDEYY